MVYRERTIGELEIAKSRTREIISHGLEREIHPLSNDEAYVLLGASHLFVRNPNRRVFYGNEVARLTNLGTGVYPILRKLIVWDVVENRPEEPSADPKLKFLAPTETGLEVFNVFQNPKKMKRG